VFLSALLDSVGALALRASRKRVDRQVTLSAIIVILLAAISQLQLANNIFLSYQTSTSH